MRKLIATAAAGIAACSTAPAQPPAHGETTGHECQPSGLERFAGQPATDEVRSEILRVSGAAVLRWVQPGQMATMEYRADRVTAWLAAADRIERVSCG